MIALALLVAMAGNAFEMPASELAATVLPPAVARRIIGRRFSGHPGRIIHLYAAAEPLGDRLCARDTYILSPFGAAGTRRTSLGLVLSGPFTEMALAGAETCIGRETGFVLNIMSAERHEPLRVALEALAAVIAAAGAKRPLTFDVVFADDVILRTIGTLGSTSAPDARAARMLLAGIDPRRLRLAAPAEPDKEGARGNHRFSVYHEGQLLEIELSPGGEPVRRVILRRGPIPNGG